MHLHIIVQAYQLGFISLRKDVIRCSNTERHWCQHVFDKFLNVKLDTRFMCMHQKLESNLGLLFIFNQFVLWWSYFCFLIHWCHSFQFHLRSGTMGKSPDLDCFYILRHFSLSLADLHILSYLKLEFAKIQNALLICSLARQCTQIRWIVLKVCIKLDY